MSRMNGVTTQVESGIKTKEASRLVRGKGTFLANRRVPGSLHAAFLRSPHAHARLTRIDTARAAASPGVHDVIIGEELAVKTEPILTSLPMRIGAALSADGRTPVFHALSVAEVHFVGDPVAIVVADSRHLAEDAVAEIEVDWEPLPSVVDAEAALEPGSPPTFSDWENNLGLHYEQVNGDVAAAFAAATQHSRGG
jgi:carbon-monoxide dehydrogenase large subunit